MRVLFTPLLQYIILPRELPESQKRGIKTNSKAYKIIEKDLDCLLGIKIKAVNAFWDNEVKKYVDKTFHLFDSLDLYKNRPTGQGCFAFSQIKASDVLYGSVLKNSLLIANFDSEFFHSLTPIEQRLSFYLSKVFRSQIIHKRELAGFAHQIPIHAKQTKHIKEQLKKGCEGLLAKKFDLLESYDFEKSADKKSELIIFRRKTKPPGEVQIKQLGYEKEKTTRDHEINYLVNEIITVCEDQNSLNFYRKVAHRMPQQTIHRALGEVKQMHHSGEIKKCKGALFTNLIKKYAAEQGVKL